jgi:CPA2 family monovalent cation:H+ antiporter-2
LNAYIIQIVLHTAIIAAVILLSAKFVAPLVADTRFGNTLAALITLIVIAPFLWALSLRRIAVEEVETYCGRNVNTVAHLLMLILIRMSLRIILSLASY